MVVYHDRGPSTSARLAGACVVARLRTVTAFQRPPRGGLRRLGRECAQKPGTLTSRVSKGATTRLQPCREPARSSQPPGRAACTWGAALWPLRRGVSVRRTAYDGPLSSATVPDGGGRQRTCHGAASLDKRSGRLYAAPGCPLRPGSFGAAFLSLFTSLRRLPGSASQFPQIDFEGHGATADRTYQQPCRA